MSWKGMSGGVKKGLAFLGLVAVLVLGTVLIQGWGHRTVGKDAIIASKATEAGIKVSPSKNCIECHQSPEKIDALETKPVVDPGAPKTEHG